MTDDQLPLKQLDTSTANELAETILLQKDMQSSLEAMKLLFKRYSNAQSGKKIIIAQSLFRDAVVQFVGCFDETAKYALSVDDVYEKTDGGVEYFLWIKDIRDAFAAHKFGPLRQCVVGVLVDASGTKVLGPGELFHIYMGPQKDHGPALLKFMEIAADYLNEKVKNLKAQMLEETQNMPPEEIAALPIASLHGVGPSEIRKSRPKFQKSRSENPPDKKQSSS